MPLIVAILVTVLSVVILTHSPSSSPKKILGTTTKVSATSRVKPTATNTQTPTPTVYVEDSPVQSNIAADDSDWKYPNSTRIDLGGGNYYYQSYETPEVITAWYKQKISGLGLSLQTFVQSNTNGDTENKLSASNGKMYISVSIEKKSQDTSTKITVTVTQTQ